MLSVLHGTPWLASKFSLWPAAPPVPSLLSKHQVTFPVENYPPAIASLTSICLDPRGRAQSPQPACTVPENIWEGQATVQEAVGSQHGYFSYIKRAPLAWVQV